MDSRKQYEFSETARRELGNGVVKLCRLVGSTLGPGGRFVVIARPDGFPTSTKDGVTVAKEVILEGMEGVGARMALEASSKTAEEAGDGTTSAICLIERLVSGGLVSIDQGKHNPVHVASGIRKASAWAVGEVIRLSIPVHGPMVEQVAITSANGDREVGHNILLAMQGAGPDGVITVVGSRDGSTGIEHTEGMQFGEGYITPYFVTDPSRMEAVIDNPLILLLDRRLSSLQGFGGFLEQLSMQSRPLLIVCEDIDGEALPTLVVNKQGQKFLAVGVKAPRNLGAQSEFLRDIAAYTGGTAILQELGIATSRISLQMLGQADKAIVTRNSTTIYGGRGSREEIAKRAAEIRSEVTSEGSRPVDREKAQERLAKLSGGLTTLRVGAGSEAEMKERMARVEDAIYATRCAVAEGVVPGAGMTLYWLAGQMTDTLFSNEGERAGGGVVKEALREPALRILANAGMGLTGDGPAYGYGIDSTTGEEVSLVQAGILDPAKVVRCELGNASSVAAVMLLCESIILDTPPRASGRLP